MLTWFADQANVFYFLFGAAALALLAAGWQTRRTKFWAYAAGAVGLMLLVWLLTSLVITDRQQILLNLDAMRQATVQKKPDELFQHISKDFRFGTMSRDDLYKRVGNIVAANKITNIHLTSQHVTVKGDVADAEFTFRVDAEGTFLAPAAAKTKFVREGGRWKLSEMQLFKPGTTDRLHVPGLD
jgi:hypothetical protein